MRNCTTWDSEHTVPSRRTVAHWLRGKFVSPSKEHGLAVSVSASVAHISCGSGSFRFTATYRFPPPVLGQFKRNVNQVLREMHPAWGGQRSVSD
jgi:hypothetical protein